MAFALVIPLFNEENNIPELVKMISRSRLIQNDLTQVILVNNGSLDKTGTLIDDLGRIHAWITPVHLKENLYYGGGVLEGFKACREDVVGYIPGDLQVKMDDVEKVWTVFKEKSSALGTLRLLCKGWRVVRKDGFNTQLVSTVYTFLANMILFVGVHDVNGLPKIFHKDLYNLLPDEKMKTFVLDAQWIFTARKNRWPIIEVPVTFHARRSGISSWSRKRLQTYVTTLKQIVRLRSLKYPQV